jgi:hypothetical protein
MNKNSCSSILLEKGEVQVYDFCNARLHAYRTNDPMADEVFILEKDGRALVLEAPCFAANITELNRYVDQLHVRTEAKLLSYHNAGGGFLPQIPVYATQNAKDHASQGGGKAMVEEFADAFGAAFDASLHPVTNIIKAGPVKIAGFDLEIIPGAEAFDVEIPEFDAIYIHMLGHDIHSIVAGAAHADALIAQLEDIITRGFDLILTSHYTPEDPADAKVKIDYLKSLKSLAAASRDAAAFKKSVQQKFPGYTGENYLDMTTGFFFP